MFYALEIFQTTSMQEALAVNSQLNTDWSLQAFCLTRDMVESPTLSATLM